MASALSSAVTGLQAFQQMLDVAGNNLANTNTTAYKASRITFSALLSETLQSASSSTSTTGGTNPQQIGSGVGVSTISSDMTQGSIASTGNPLDMAISGEGYFVLSDGSQNVYTRAGAFSVDADGNLVDSSTGYIVQRIGTTGESDGFQTPGDSNIKIPYDVAIPAQETTTVSITGNVSSDSSTTVQTNVLSSNIDFTTDDGTAATSSTLLSELDQFSGALTTGVLTFSGYTHDGIALGEDGSSLTMTVDSTTTLGDVLDFLNVSCDGTVATDEVQTLSLSAAAASGTFTLTCNGETTAAISYDATADEIEQALVDAGCITEGDVTVSGTAESGTLTFTYDDSLDDVTNITFTSSLKDSSSADITGTVAETTKGNATQGLLGDSATASLSGGALVITDTESGYSQTDFMMSYSGDGELTLPTYFEYETVGGEEVQSVSITVYDSLGGEHVLSGALVRTDTENTWDFVMTSITGDVSSIDISGLSDRRIKGIQFDETDGSYEGLSSTIGDTTDLTVTFASDTANPQTITLDFGTIGGLDGLTQFSGSSTAVASDQDGYESGTLSSVAVDSTGTLIGTFSNGVKKEIATLQIALFTNTSGLESIGNNYYLPTVNSGEAVVTTAGSAGAGSIEGSSLEESNVDTATEFVNLIEAQNGYQANARTITVANEILQELTSLIR